MRKVILWSSLLIIAYSCGKKSPVPGQDSEKIYYISPAEMEGYSYEFRKYSCTTGVQSFVSFVAACEGLTDEIANNDCALKERQSLFESSDCPGSF